MKRPPKQIDGADVLYWAWSDHPPFGLIQDTEGVVAAEIFGLAICQYKGSNNVYRFSCDRDWKTQQDSDYDSIEQAMQALPTQYKGAPAYWRALAAASDGE